MNIYIEYINKIRMNLGMDSILSEDHAKDIGLGDPNEHFQELVADLSDEVYDLRKRLEEIENETQQIPRP